ncbi:MAG TPA: glycosyltransferase [Candidatus Methanoperedens sp.]|nr:glycosyltransferase [Candidatus Methanoperedens sp.]
MRTVIILRERLLGYSETFILNHYLALRKFRPVLAGVVNEHQLDLGRCRRIIIGDARPGIRAARAVVYKMFGFEPLFFRALQQQRPALVHVHFGMDAARGLRLLSRLTCPFVVTFHGVDATTSDEWKLRSGSPYLKRYVHARKELIQRAALFIAVSRFVKERLVAQGFPEGRIRVVPLGVDTDFFRPDAATPRSRNVLFVGRLVENKGCRYLIEAMRDVQTAHPGSTLIVAGAGPLRGELEAYARALSVSAEFVGARSQSGIRDLMNRSCIFAVPSIQVASGASEGLGVVFCEAQSMGLPVVSFRTGGIPEAVVDEETGFLCPPRNAMALGQSIRRLLEDDHLWARFSGNAREHCAANFNHRARIDELESLYEEVIANAPRSGGPGGRE